MPSDPRQLTLPLVAAGSGIASPRSIARSDRVFVNRDLRFSNIDWIGFDMDYTLAIYRQERMDTLSVELTIERMIRRGYPAYLKNLAYDIRFPIRGLLVDKRYGHVLKMDRYKVVPARLPTACVVCPKKRSPRSITTSASGRTRRATIGSTRYLR
ncbi:MAG: 5'-nucleotidase domain-containing protein [Pseudomonadota bacterium]